MAIVYEVLKVVAGYEVPLNISQQCTKILHRLKSFGIVIFEHDDGPSSSIRHELEEIAGNIGLTTFSERYRLVVIDDDGYKTFRFFL